MVGPETSWRDEPNKAATTAGIMAAYSPYSGGIPAIVAKATPWGSTTMAPVTAARASARRVLPLTSGHHARKGANFIQKSRFKLRTRLASGARAVAARFDFRTGW